MKGLTLVSLCSIFFIFTTADGADTIAVNQSIIDGETIVSAGSNFELGFFSPRSTSLRYVGIWYKFSSETLVWVANREAPLNDTSGVLQVTSKGILVLHNSTNVVLWSTNTSRVPQNPVAQLLDSGNLVIREANDTNEDDYLWDSFDYPGNTFLPGLKFGRNLITGLDRYLVSWKSTNDPSLGDSTTMLDPGGYPQIFIRVGENIIFRSGPWNGLKFSGMPNLKPNPIYTYEFVYNEKEIYYRYDLTDSSVVTRMLLTNDGILQRFTWTSSTRTWNLYLTAQMDNCDRYAVCGAYGICNIDNSPACACLDGFQPKSRQDWDSGDWSGGCVRKNESICRAGEGFQKVTSVKLPDTRTSSFNMTMDLEECRRVCLMNCSCTAYSTLNITDGTGCLLWFEDLLDIREYTETGQDFYIRLSASDLARMVSMQERDYSINSTGKDLELPVFDFATIAIATSNFSGANKLGEGGFGPVYKGKLEDGQEIAVKRLSKTSTQGLDEFKNEVICIAKLQHRNLVKLLGCCIESEETMLVYEYMPNKSLDAFIFDQKQSKLLDWSMRYNIINGVARGLLYLHQDSRLRIIHRDLKASNILVDYDMNPKISDFGMARSFGGNEIQGNTKRVVGTYGYMSPEYATDGIFSIKSDVFSFGVLVLEIVNGKRNRGFIHQDHKHNLLGHAWKLYKEERSFELINDSLKDTCNLSEVLRVIHVGLLCVQQAPEDRPTMSTVVLMLSSNIALPDPKEPGFFTERKLFDHESSSSKVDTCSANEITITLLTAR
ncbi:G-type lectin S-receptor-like serine/threonine-protein kinase At4g27290 isoform X2 [Populus trichocarpa]|uniref:G-type lectin S-receptor-like serine/threonine-protein kinase At4g27290 isoform X2 n=1 Tax=Populus trichocarpa TaxID=3694 RepID=UPI000D18A1BA|nr:G-type lectin S-receptor-like serine/threonine-protein kinase At4g27290 isoform X2 [Populus trichocarpa]|eukprot:XP_024447887.1 G-type lectin S-receptor-like serine/threonine-protein kinase At4g27290 isoform X2 [Populus trichocarpa]